MADSNFLSEDLSIINGAKSSSIKKDGEYNDTLNNRVVDDVVAFGDEWTNTHNSQEGSNVIGKVTSADIYDVESNFVKKDGEDVSRSRYIYDDSKGTLKFKDETLIKQNEFGCTYTGSDEVNFKDMVRDLEILSAYNRIPDFGTVYDFQVRQMNFGIYKYANALLCVNLAKSLGYMSLDKIINDEYITKKGMNDLNARFTGTADADKYPVYSGWLDSEEYINGGWVDIDKLIQKTLSNEWAYDTDWSLAVRTKKFQDRKRALVYLILTYTSSIWELNSSNKIVDFGLRIIDKTSGKQLDYSDVKDGLRSIMGQTMTAHFIGELGGANTNTDGTLANGQPSTSEECKDSGCDKSYVSKCDGIIFKKDCQSSVANTGSPEDISTGSSHVLMPQFKLNPLSNYRRDKPDILNTIDPINWTTGNVEYLRDTFKESYRWLDDITKKFGETTYESTPLNQNRAFHYAGGTFSDGMALGGFYHKNDIFTSREYWGLAENVEVWNGTAWRVAGTAPITRGLGLGGGTSDYFVSAYGVKPVWNVYEDEVNGTKVSPYKFTTAGMSKFYEYNNGSWSDLDIDPIIEKHSVAGVINASRTGNTASTVKNEGFAKTQLPNTTECIEGCTITNSQFLAFLPNSSGDVSYKKIVSGFCFNGSRGPVVLDGRNYCEDFDDNVIFFSYIDAVRSKTAEELKTSPTPSTVSLTTKCSFADSTKKYPVGKTIGTCYVGTGTHGIATGGKTCSPLQSCDGADARTNKYNRYFDTSKYHEEYDSTVKYAYEWNGTAWTRREDMPEDVAFHCGVGDEKWSIFWGGLHSSVERANVSLLVPGCDTWYDVMAAFNGAFNKYGLCGLSGEIRYADFANVFVDKTSDVSGADIYITVDEISGHRGHYKQTTVPISGNLMYITVYEGGNTVLVSPMSGEQDCFCVTPCSGMSITGSDISASKIFYDESSLANAVSVDWTGKTYIVDSDIYNYRHTNLCDLITNNYNKNSPSEGGILLSSLSSYGSKWIWSVPMDILGDEESDEFFIQRSSAVVPTEHGCEVVRSVVRGTTARVSRAIVADSYSDGIGMYGFGKSYIASADVSGFPISGFFEYQDVGTPMSYDNAMQSFPWVAIGDEGSVGPRGCVEMFDESGNYWFAIGDANNKKASEITSTHLNSFTIVMVPESKFSKFNELIIAKTNLSAARKSIEGFEIAKKFVEQNPITGLYSTNKTARNREGLIEAVNAYNGQDVFDVYIKLFDYNLSSLDTDNPFIANSISVVASGGTYDLPYFESSASESNRVEGYDIVTTKDINCLSCYTCNSGEVDKYAGKNWTQHYHEEWAAPYIQHPLAGIVSRSGFNVWLSAGDCSPRWGTSIWTTLDNGRVWVHYKRSRVAVNELRNHLVYSVITSSFTIDNYGQNATSDIPVLNKYDEFIFNLSDYEGDAFIDSLIAAPEDKEKICDEQTSIYVPESIWTLCTTDCTQFTTFTSPSCSASCADTYIDTFTGCVTGQDGIGNYSIENFDPDIGYVEWATSFVMEYKKPIITENSKDDKYYYKYNVDEVGSNCIKDREPINDQGLIETAWRRYQDGVGLGGDAPLFNRPGTTFTCNSSLSNFIGQKAFGDPDKAIICGGYSVESNGELAFNHAFWNYFTQGPTFKWNRFVINPEDTVNKNYTYRNLSPFFSNFDQTTTDSIHGSVIFDVSGPVAVERYGQVFFNNTNEANVEFEEFPDFITTKDKYSISLTPSDNVRVWWESKEDGAFTIKCELATWTGTVDWKVIYIDNIPVDQIDGVDSQTTFDGYEDK